MDFEEFLNNMRKYKESYEAGRAEAIKDMADLGAEGAMDKYMSDSDRGPRGRCLFEHYRHLGYINALY